VFNTRTGQQVQRFDGNISFSERDFGISLAIEGETVVIGSPANFDRGEIRVFNALTGEENWSYGYMEDGNRFYPKDVAVDGDLVAVGLGAASFDMPEVLVFDRASGALLNRVNTSIPNENDNFKYQMDLDGTRIVVGSWGTFYDGIGYYVGDVSVFDAHTGEVLASFTNPHPDSGDNFGFSVAMAGGRVLVGAPGEVSGRGIAYSYVVVPEPATAVLALLYLFGAATVRYKGAR
jgi:outer membrane protein assembly factor BamB